MHTHRVTVILVVITHLCYICYPLQTIPAQGTMCTGRQYTIVPQHWSNNWPTGQLWLHPRPYYPSSRIQIGWTWPMSTLNQQLSEIQPTHWGNFIYHHLRDKGYNRDASKQSLHISNYLPLHICTV